MLPAENILQMRVGVCTVFIILVGCMFCEVGFLYSGVVVENPR